MCILLLLGEDCWFMGGGCWFMGGSCGCTCTYVYLLGGACWFLFARGDMLNVCDMLIGVLIRQRLLFYEWELLVFVDLLA